MNALTELQQRFRLALAGLSDDPESLLEMIRPAQDARFGDYQANCAMPLGKQSGQAPREVAEQILQQLDVSDFCLEPEIAGPGFINLRLQDSLPRASRMWDSRLSQDHGNVKEHHARVQSPVSDSLPSRLVIRHRGKPRPLGTQYGPRAAPRDAKPSPQHREQ